MDKNDFYYYAKYANVALSFGLTLVGSVGGLGWGGYYLDRKIGTVPVFMIAGVMIGITISFKGLYDLMRGMEQHDLMEHEARNPVYQRAMNLRRLYFKKARIKKSDTKRDSKE